MKLLQLLVLGAIVWFIYNAVRRALQGPAQNQAESNAPQQPPTGQPQSMRKCSLCGVHIPEGESSQSRGHFFCCEAHRDQFFARSQ